MSQPLSPPDGTTLERSLANIRGVTAARIVMTPSGVIEEIHVVGPPTRSPKSVVRDVGTVLYVQHGVRVDYRKISIVQIDSQRLPAVMVRVALLDVTPQLDGDSPTVTVSLRLHDVKMQGIGRARADRPATPEELAGYATTHALDQLISPRGRVRLETLVRHGVGPLEVVVVHLSLISDQSMETLLGISLINDDVIGAAARAVLDAVNRRIPRLLGETQ